MLLLGPGFDQVQQHPLIRVLALDYVGSSIHICSWPCQSTYVHQIGQHMYIHKTPRIIVSNLLISSQYCCVTAQCFDG
jgi:hypothetical protein